MEKTKIKNIEEPLEEDNNEDEIKINQAESSIVEFTKRELPTEEQIEQFDEYIQEEARDDEIDESLNEIYQDDKGKAVDVKRLDIKKKRGFFFWFFTLIILAAIFGASGYGAYNYYLESGTDATALELSLDGPTEVSAGEEFFYTISFKNTTAIELVNARLTLKYPENFVFLDAQPFADSQNSVWNYSSIPPGRTDNIKIKGKIISEEDETGIVLANLSYTPVNFSSEFKKDKSFTTTVKDIGVEFDYDYISSVLIGEENELIVKYRARIDNYINNFRLTAEPQENIEFLKSGLEEKEGEEAKIEEVRPGVWNINEITDEEAELKIKFKVSEKTADNLDIRMFFEQDDGAGNYLKFKEEVFTFEVMKSDLNLTLIINGAREDKGVDFGDTLHYSIVYNNKGETEMKDVVIMAVLESDFLDWTALDNPSQGREKGNTLSWTKAEIAGLELIEPENEGTIDFSIKVSNLGEIVEGKEYEVKSYAQYTVGNADEISENIDNRSNTIVNKINSDLELTEEVRYFSDDNIAVGSGPLPPKAGETTSFKVYWSLFNSLHELAGARIEAALPDYVSYDNKSQASAGSVDYISEGHKIVWEIGRLPITVLRVDAEFNVKITPTEEDKGKIMVILPGSIVTARDSETEAELTKTTGAKTTKLEDDEIAGSDGIVR